MARISITTDDGEVINILSDADDEIGDLTKNLARSDVMNEIATAVRDARQKDRRKPSGEE